MPIYTDTFTEVDGTLLTSHVGGFGAWHAAVGPGPDTFPIYSNRLRIYDPTGDSSWENHASATIAIPAAGFDIYFDALASANSSLFSQPVKYGIALIGATGSTGWFGYLYWFDEGGGFDWWTVQLYQGAAWDLIINANAFGTTGVATASLSTTEAFRFGFEFGSNGVVRAFKEPSGGGTRTYLTSANGAAVAGSWNPALAGDYAPLVYATAMTPDICWLDNLSVETAEAPVTEVTVSGGGTVSIGGTLQLTAVTVPVGRTVTWTSSDEDVATVAADGLVTGVAAGTATITATSEGIEGKRPVTVTQAPIISAVPAATLFTLAADETTVSDLTVAISNIGTGTLTGLALEDTVYPGPVKDWLTASISGTTAPATVTLAAETVGVFGTVYSATISVTSTAAGVRNSPFELVVHLVVPPWVPVITETNPRWKTTGELDELNERLVGQGLDLVAGGGVEWHYADGDTAEIKVEVETDATTWAAPAAARTPTWG